MLIGGAARDWWENRRLLPKVEKIRLKDGTEKAEKKRALMLLFTFMIAAGALTGEAFYGVETAALAVGDEVKVSHTYEPDNWMEESYLDEMIGAESDDFSQVIQYATEYNSNPANKEKCDISLDSVTCPTELKLKTWWPQVRMMIFIAVNLGLAFGVYKLFKAAGIIGSLPDEISSDDEILDAELVEK
jgi:hypothetical protein